MDEIRTATCEVVLDRDQEEGCESEEKTIESIKTLDAYDG